MPIQLTNEFNPGDFDVGNYSQVKITSYVVEVLEKRITLACQYGNTIEGIWVPGINSRKTVLIGDRAAVGVEGDPGYISPVTDFTDFVTNTKFSGTDVIVYAIVQQALYNWLIDHDIFDGTIV